MLSFKKKEVFEIDYSELDKLINDNYFDGKPVFECVAYEEWSNYSDLMNLILMVNSMTMILSSLTRERNTTVLTYISMLFVEMESYLKVLI